MKTYLSDDRTPPSSQIGAALDSLAKTIHERRNAGEESYTYRLLTGDLDKLLKNWLKKHMKLRLRQKIFRLLAVATIRVKNTMQTSTIFAMKQGTLYIIFWFSLSVTVLIWKSLLLSLILV